MLLNLFSYFRNENSNAEIVKTAEVSGSIFKHQMKGLCPLRKTEFINEFKTIPPGVTLLDFRNNHLNRINVSNDVLKESFKLIPASVNEETVIARTQRVLTRNNTTK